MQFSQRIRSRAAKLEHGDTLLEIASRSDVQQDMLRCARERGKPITALSKPLIDAIGLANARDDNLRRLAGEVAAFVVEKEFSCVRRSGARIIVGDPVFTTGQPFQIGIGYNGSAARYSEEAGTDNPLVAVLLAALDDAALQRLEEHVRRERTTRSGGLPKGIR
jgi:hypothetical protein